MQVPLYRAILVTALARSFVPSRLARSSSGGPTLAPLDPAAEDPRLVKREVWFCGRAFVALALALALACTHSHSLGRWEGAPASLRIASPRIA